MEQNIINGEEVVGYTVAEFIEATRPDGQGHIYLDDQPIAAFEEVLCDCCNAEIVQPQDEPEALEVFALMDRAWCRECFARWALT